jgi:hypothetical protein
MQTSIGCSITIWMNSSMLNMSTSKFFSYIWFASESRFAEVTLT